MAKETNARASFTFETSIHKFVKKITKEIMFKECLTIGYLHDDVILPQPQESFNLLLSCPNWAIVFKAQRSPPNGKR